MRDDWEIKDFGDVCKIVGGSQPPKSEFIYEPKEGYIRLIQVRDYKTDKYLTYIPKDSTKKFCTINDIMIGRYGPPIFGIFRGIEGAYNVALMKAIPNEEFLDKEYFYWFLHNPDLIKFVEITSKRAAGQDGVRKKRLYKYPVPIPPLSEQKRIVAILDEAFEAIDQAKANIERNIHNAEELFQSKLNEIFSQRGEGWEEKRLDEVCENLDRMRDPISKKNRKEGPYPYYGASGIVDYVDDYLFDEDLLLVSEDGANLLARTYPIAFSISGKNWVNNHAHVLRFEEMASQKFVEYYLNSIKLDPWVSGMAQPKLNQRNLNSIPVPFPSIDEQKEVVDRLKVLENDVESITKVYKDKADSLNELKKSILQKAFSGELTANEHAAA